MRFGDDRIPERMWNAMSRDDSGCWLWTGSKHQKGWGQVKWQGRPVRTHRIMYSLSAGVDIDRGTIVTHSCGERSCCNPAHFVVMSHSEHVNSSDNPASRNARKTHCKHGHEFTPENTKICSRGFRNCRECGRNRKRGDIGGQKKRRRNRVKDRMRELKSVPCADCGRRYHHVCMDFDHLDPAKKVENVGSIANRGTMAAMLREARKCEVVCANCHRLRTYTRRDFEFSRAG